MSSRVLTNGLYNVPTEVKKNCNESYASYDIRGEEKSQKIQRKNENDNNKARIIDIRDANGNDWDNAEKSIGYDDVDLPNSADFIYAATESKDHSAGVDGLIPSAARLLLSQKRCSKTRSDLLDNDFGSEDLGDFSDEFESEVEEPEPEPEPAEEVIEYNHDTNTSSSRDYVSIDYGLEAIQEETESQMSSSDTDDDFDSEAFPVGNSKPVVARKPKSHSTREGLIAKEIMMDFPEGVASSPYIIAPDAKTVDNDNVPEEIVTKHIRIPVDWDPDPILRRLYNVGEPRHSRKVDTQIMTGNLSILSGNRKKGTFWNAWRKKYYVLSAGKLNGFENDSCSDMFQSINLVGGKVDFLDPSDFVGADQSKLLTNRIVGVDDGKGHYFVLQCSSASEALRWVAALQSETLPSAATEYAIPVLSKSIPTFRDIVLVDFGSTSIRGGVLGHQPILPALFFSSAASKSENGVSLFGDAVYYNRKGSKISFPMESTPKLCQNKLNMVAIEGFLKKVFKELKVEPQNFRIIVNLPRRVDNSCKSNLLRLLFDTFRVKGALLQHQSVAAFYSYNSDNGIVCDIGERCDIVPVSQGFVLSQAWQRAPFGGHVLKHALRQGLGPQENGLYLSTPAENLILRYISENFLHINSANSRKISLDSHEVVVEMDLREVLSIPTLIGVSQNVLRSVGEGYFDPGLYGLDCESLPKLVYKTLQDSGMDIRKEMSQNILVSGGCTMIPGFVERLEQELTKLCPPHLKPKVKASPYRYHASFIGASVLATTDAFEKSLLPSTKYDGGAGPNHWLV